MLPTPVRASLKNRQICYFVFHFWLGWSLGQVGVLWLLFRLRYSALNGRNFRRWRFLVRNVNSMGKVRHA